MSPNQSTASSEQRAPEPKTGATPSRFSRRDVLRAGTMGAAAIAAAPVLAACGSSKTAQGKAKATIRMWTWYTQQQTVFPKLVKQYEDAHPNVTIENRIFGTYTNYTPALEGAVSAGNPPDIFGPGVLAITYGKSGIALDLKQALGSAFLSDFFESTNAEYTYQGKQYGIGWMAQTFGLFYNPSILAKAGVAVPETWDDVIAAAAPIKSKTGATPLLLVADPSSSASDLYLPLITQATNNPQLVLNMDQQVDGAKWTNPAVVTAFEKLSDLVKAGVFETGALATQQTAAEALFYTGKGAMFYNGSFALQDFQTEAPKSFLDLYKIAQTPAWTAGAKHWCANQAGAGLSVSAKSPYAEETIAFLKWLYDPTRYSATMNESDSMPSTKSAAGKITDPRNKQMTSWLLEGNGCPHILFGAGSEDAVGNGVQTVMQGSKTPTQVASEIQAAVEQAKRVQ